MQMAIAQDTGLAKRYDSAVTTIPRPSSFTRIGQYTSIDLSFAYFYNEDQKRECPA